MDLLPNELLQIIFSYLDFESKKQILLTKKNFYNIINTTPYLHQNFKINVHSGVVTSKYFPFNRMAFNTVHLMDIGYDENLLSFLSAVGKYIKCIYFSYLLDDIDNFFKKMSLITNIEYINICSILIVYEPQLSRHFSYNSFTRYLNVPLSNLLSNGSTISSSSQIVFDKLKTIIIEKSVSDCFHRLFENSLNVTHMECSDMKMLESKSKLKTLRIGNVFCTDQSFNLNKIDFQLDTLFIENICNSIDDSHRYNYNVDSERLFVLQIKEKYIKFIETQKNLKNFRLIYTHLGAEVWSEINIFRDIINHVFSLGTLKTVSINVGIKFPSFATIINASVTELILYSLHLYSASIYLKCFPNLHKLCLNSDLIDDGSLEIMNSFRHLKHLILYKGRCTTYSALRLKLNSLFIPSLITFEVNESQLTGDTVHHTKSHILQTFLKRHNNLLSLSFYIDWWKNFDTLTFILKCKSLKYLHIHTLANVTTKSIVINRITYFLELIAKTRSLKEISIIFHNDIDSEEFKTRLRNHPITNSDVVLKVKIYRDMY